MTYTDPIFTMFDAVVILLGVMGGSVIGLGLAAICEWLVHNFREKLMRVLILLGAMLLVGCYQVPEGRLKTGPVDEAVQFAGTSVKVVRLQDGTRCAVYGDAGGVDCDWKRESVERP